MAKKNKRKVSKELTLAPEKVATEPTVGSRPTGFNPDYQYVIRDLRRVAVLAGSFIIILISLAIFLH
jgi:hypothetical protein